MGALRNLLLRGRGSPVAPPAESPTQGIHHRFGGLAATTAIGEAMFAVVDLETTGFAARGRRSDRRGLDRGVRFARPDVRQLDEPRSAGSERRCLVDTRDHRERRGRRSVLRGSCGSDSRPPPRNRGGRPQRRLRHLVPEGGVRASRDGAASRRIRRRHHAACAVLLPPARRRIRSSPSDLLRGDGNREPRSASGWWRCRRDASRARPLPETWRGAWLAHVGGLRDRATRQGVATRCRGSPPSGLGTALERARGGRTTHLRRTGLLAKTGRHRRRSRPLS